MVEKAGGIAKRTGFAMPSDYDIQSGAFVALNDFRDTALPYDPVRAKISRMVFLPKDTISSLMTRQGTLITL